MNHRRHPNRISKIRGIAINICGAYVVRLLDQVTCFRGYPVP